MPPFMNCAVVVVVVIQTLGVPVISVLLRLMMTRPTAGWGWSSFSHQPGVPPIPRLPPRRSALPKPPSSDHAVLEKVMLSRVRMLSDGKYHFRMTHSPAGELC
ncbi:hypothetical protein GE09DRAFT_1109775 [Coniochaeta sp. 2T2.1]|nr:hypothetical protein GE09DRAFT_1109775 [Coniochaeta sp. 2T2.1]